MIIFYFSISHNNTFLISGYWFSLLFIHFRIRAASGLLRWYSEPLADNITTISSTFILQLIYMPCRPIIHIDYFFVHTGAMLTSSDYISAIEPINIEYICSNDDKQLFIYRRAPFTHNDTTTIWELIMTIFLAPAIDDTFLRHYFAIIITRNFTSMFRMLLYFTSFSRHYHALISLP